MAILHRRVVVVESWDERAEARVVMLERKKEMSAERMGRSASEARVGGIEGACLLSAIFVKCMVHVLLHGGSDGDGAL